MQENYRESEVQLRKFAKNQKYKYRILSVFRTLGSSTKIRKTNEMCKKNGKNLPSAILRPSDKTLENARRP